MLEQNQAFGSRSLRGEIITQAIWEVRDFNGLLKPTGLLKPPEDLKAISWTPTRKVSLYPVTFQYDQTFPVQGVRRKPICNLAAVLRTD